jgi:hypothetical protein
MKKLLVVSALLGGLLLAPLSAQAHCDTLDGPVAKVAIKALETGNVNAVLPYAPATAEAEITAAFEQAQGVRGKDAEARRLADRFFLETVVRLHRQGENAPYTGLKPAGMDFGPVIPAAENALESGDSEALVSLLTNALRHHVQKRIQHSLEARSLPRETTSYAEVAAARERVHAELGFVLYAEALHQAIKGQGLHAEGGHSD